MKIRIIVLSVFIIVLLFVLSSCNRVKRSDIRDLMEDKLVDEFLIVSLYLEGQEYTRSEAEDAFNTIVTELNKLY